MSSCKHLPTAATRMLRPFRRGNFLVFEPVLTPPIVVAAYGSAADFDNAGRVVVGRNCFGDGEPRIEDLESGGQLINEGDVITPSLCDHRQPDANSRPGFDRPASVSVLLDVVLVIDGLRSLKTVKP